MIEVKKHIGRGDLPRGTAGIGTAYVLVREEELKEQVPLGPDLTSKIFREIPMRMIRENRWAAARQ